MVKKEYRKKIIKILIALKMNGNKKFSIELSSFINESFKKFSKDSAMKASYFALIPYLDEKRKKVQFSFDLEKRFELIIGGLINELYG